MSTNYLSSSYTSLRGAKLGVIDPVASHQLGSIVGSARHEGVNLEEMSKSKYITKQKREEFGEQSSLYVFYGKATNSTFDPRRSIVESAT